MNPASSEPIALKRDCAATTVPYGRLTTLPAGERIYIVQTLGESITVRKISFGHGVERIFPLHARVVDHIDVLRTGRVRRAKLYYLRELKGKAARLRERE